MLLLLTGCFSTPPVPRELVEAKAPALSELGHPQATYQGVDIVGWSNGAPEKGERYLDLKIRYLRENRPEPNEMTVRIYQESVDPCRMSLDVLFDDGPEPLLLDNAIASKAIGVELCDALSTR
jgi:hypothetical protein